MLEILAAAIANFLTRFLPFIFLKKHYKKFLFLKDEFPIVLLTILTLYMIFPKNLNLSNLYEQLIAIGITVVLHLIFRKFLLSVFVGSFVYIILTNHLL